MLDPHGILAHDERGEVLDDGLLSVDAALIAEGAMRTTPKSAKCLKVWAMAAASSMNMGDFTPDAEATFHGYQGHILIASCNEIER